MTPKACIIDQKSRGHVIETHALNGAFECKLVAVVVTDRGKLLAMAFDRLHLGRCMHCANGLTPVAGTDWPDLWHGRDLCLDHKQVTGGPKT